MANKRKKSSHRTQRSRRTYMTPLVIVVAILTVGCIWAVTKKESFVDDSGKVSRIENVSDLERVLVPSSLSQQIKSYEGFTVNFNRDNRTANYVSWELLGSETDGISSRKGEKFWKDEDIANCPETKDYTRSGYDRGHLYPAADAKWSGRSMKECFTMANITPQVHSLNGGAWKTLEEKERLWAVRDSALVIIAGPVYQQADNKRIGASGVRVPSAFFKVIFAPYVEYPRAIAFVYPNDYCPGNMQNYAQSVDYVEQLTGFDFFSTLPDDVEEKIESTYSFKEWNQH